MAKLVAIPKIDLNVNFQLNESECRALEALSGYDVEAFLKTFYEKMGKHYLQPHEAGLRSLFKSVTENIPFLLSQMDKARDKFKQTERG